jgi:chemotaxis protein MotB
MRRKGTRGGHEQHDNSERWLLTYADLITLLLGLFVILYAMSKIDAGRYNQVVTALGGVFGSPRGVLVGEGAALENQMSQLLTERQRIAREVNSALALDRQKLPISVNESKRGVTVHIMEELLFTSGSAEIRAASLPALDTLARILKTLPNDIRVEGHTDNVPITTAAFPSNWHLSVSRAVNVGFYLIERHRLAADKVAVVGYAEYRPLVPNDTPDHRASNRRVDIVILAQGVADDTADPHPSGSGAGIPRDTRVNAE